MVITVDPELEAALAESARAGGTTAESLALAALRRQFLPERPGDEWLARLLATASECGVSHSDEALSREAMYD